MNDRIKALTDTVRGRVITASDPDHDDARAVYNAMHDRKPGAVVQCTDSADVMAVITAARDSEAGYINFMSVADDHRAPENYGANYERLSALKAAYDPDNLFHVNQNIAPAKGR